MLKSAEDEESKKIAVEINEAERKTALDLCESLGFTLANTPGAEAIKPRALGMRGREIDFDAIEAAKSPGDMVLRKVKRVDLGQVAKTANKNYIKADQERRANDNEEFIKLDVGEGQDHEALNLNHKLRRKLRRAIDNAQIQKELLVRQRAVDGLKARGIEPPKELMTSAKAKNIPGMRVLENGAVETAKQERVRARLELAEFNQASKVLRRQAKQCAIEAGLRKHAELTGRLSLGGESSNLLLPSHINASATEAKVNAVTADDGHPRAKSAGGEADESTDESDDESEASAAPGRSGNLGRSAKRQKLDS